MVISALLITAIPVSAAESISTPITDTNTAVIFGTPVKVPEISLLAKVENKIYGENPFSGVNHNGIFTKNFTASNYTNIQINCWAKPSVNGATGKYTITLYKPNGTTFPKNLGSKEYPFSPTGTTYVGTWSNVGTGTFTAEITVTDGTTNQTIDGGITVYEVKSE